MPIIANLTIPVSSQVPNYFRFKLLGNSEILGKSQNCSKVQSSPQSPCQIRVIITTNPTYIPLKFYPLLEIPYPGLHNYVLFGVCFQVCNFNKKRHQHRLFPVKFATF